MKKSDEAKYYNWLMGADMYLATAVILCDEMLKSYVSPKDLECLNDDQQIDKRCGFTSCNPDYEMLMPAIFNLKHGMELYLKALTMKVNPKQEYSQSHNLLFLLKNLISEFVQFKPEENNILNLLNTDISQIIEKYYYGLYAFSKNKANPDKNNEAERYPEYKNGNCYKIKDLSEIDYNKLLKEIKEDVVIVQINFRENILKKI